MNEIHQILSYATPSRLIAFFWWALMVWTENRYARSLGQDTGRLISRGKTVINGLIHAAFVLPGTFLHELAHFTVGLVLFAKPASINLLPKLRDGQLGVAMFARMNIFNTPFVSLAPLLLFFPTCIVLKSDAFAGLSAYDSLVPAYLVAAMAHGALPSSSDWASARRAVVWLAVLAAAAWYLLKDGGAMISLR